MANEQFYNYYETIEVAEGVHWVGFFDVKTTLHCNPYLLIDKDEAVVFDPAGIPDYPTVASKIFSLIDPRLVNYIVMHHQDADLCASVKALAETITNKELKTVCHSRSRVFLHYYGIASKHYDVDKHDYKLTLKSGRTLRFILTPFCHFPAAIMTYDEKEKLLFSSDIFGAISSDWSLYAKEGYEEKMRLFHAGNMASNKHLRAVMEKVEELDIDKILPQHGSIIKGEMIPRCIEFLKNLDCGIDSKLTIEELYSWVPSVF